MQKSKDDIHVSLTGFSFSRMEGLAAEIWKCVYSSAWHEIDISVYGLHCYVLQHPGRWLAAGQPGSLCKLPLGAAGLELPLHENTYGDTEVGARCESYATFQENGQFCSHWLAQCHVLCRFCVFKKFKRTTLMNTCIQPCHGWVGHPAEQSYWEFMKKIASVFFLSLTQAIAVSTSGVRGPRQMAALPAIVWVASMKCPSPRWSSTGLRQSY